MMQESNSVNGVNVMKLFNSIFRPDFDPNINPTTVTDEMNPEYNMNNKNRGKCIIINNKDFDKHLGLDERRGSDVDSKHLAKQFSKLGFQVFQHKNKTCCEIQDILEEAGRGDYSDDDCIVICVLSHGSGKNIYGRDGKMSMDLIFAPFKDNVCSTLEGKPKLFFIQACQGDKYDDGVKVLVTDSNHIFQLPSHSDYFVGYCTVPGYASWRNPSNGSWFIQALCVILHNHGLKLDLLTIMIHVNRMVAYGYQSYVDNKPEMHMKKQVPYIMSALTRKVMFRPKVSLPSQV